MAHKLQHAHNGAADLQNSAFCVVGVFERVSCIEYFAGA